GNFVFVAVDCDRIAGVAAMTRAGRISLNDVSPDARFKGVSKALLAALERKAAEIGLFQCSLESTKTARRFYDAAGYRERPGLAPDAGLPLDASNCRPMVKTLG
ncbi:MAG: GNAT family N-acetyltransferase, partial [Pseudolabrys sp.]